MELAADCGNTARARLSAISIYANILVDLRQLIKRKLGRVCRIGIRLLRIDIRPPAPTSWNQSLTHYSPLHSAISSIGIERHPIRNLQTPAVKDH